MTDATSANTQNANTNTNTNNNVFADSMADANTVQEQLLGPTYPYYANIRSPSEIGMSDKGTIQQMTKDVNGLIQYVELLVSGKSKASATGKPLGNKFFLKTGAKCSACVNDASGNNQCTQEDRYIYVNNVPQGNIPFISSGMGVNFKEFRGLIPGAMGNLSVLNPFGLMRAFMTGANPPCQQITMQTIDNENLASSESHYVTLTDIQDISPCSFANNKNSVTGAKCKEAFSVKSNSTPFSSFPSFSSFSFYYLILFIFMVICIVCIVRKS